MKLIKVESNEEGADKGSFGATRDTALGSYFFCNGIERLLCANGGLILALAAQNAPEFDVAVLIVNDPRDGGAGGTVPSASTHPKASDILRHELGHTLGALADEYVSAGNYPLCGAPDCPEPNATGLLPPKWTAWVSAATLVPSPATFTGVGLFEGCRYRTTGIYRPVSTACLMNALGQPFCPVCTEALVLSFYNRVAGSVARTGCSSGAAGADLALLLVLAVAYRRRR